MLYIQRKHLKECLLLKKKMMFQLQNTLAQVRKFHKDLCMFDKRYKLPRQMKSAGLSKEEKRQNKKKLAENDKKMKIINKNKQS